MVETLALKLFGQFLYLELCGFALGPQTGLENFDNVRLRFFKDRLLLIEFSAVPLGLALERRHQLESFRRHGSQFCIQRFGFLRSQGNGDFPVIECSLDCEQSSRQFSEILDGSVELFAQGRSEERRVGKECGLRCWVCCWVY